MQRCLVYNTFISQRNHPRKRICSSYQCKVMLFARFRGRLLKHSFSNMPTARISFVWLYKLDMLLLEAKG